MAKQIASNPSNKKISELYRRIKESSLIPQPEFQRKFVWTHEHKESFIETILKGLPFPEIYIAQTGIDMEKIISTEVVVDGQQRLSTIVNYIEEKEDSKEFGKVVKKYKDLSEQEKGDFLNYNVVIRDLGDIDSQTIRDIFKRINKTKFSLEQIEIHNAVYDGDFISCAKEILNIVDKTQIPIFTESEISRMADLQFILLCMSTIENNGYFAFDGEIEKYIIQYNEQYPSSESMKKKLTSTFELIKRLGLPDDSIWYRKSNFFTIVIELAKSEEIKPKLLVKKLKDFENNIISNKNQPRDTNEFSKYYSYMYTGTNSRQARVVRSELFQKYITKP